MTASTSSTGMAASTGWSASAATTPDRRRRQRLSWTAARASTPAVRRRALNFTDTPVGWIVTSVGRQRRPAECRDRGRGHRASAICWSARRALAAFRRRWTRPGQRRCGPAGGGHLYGHVELFRCGLTVLAQPGARSTGRFTPSGTQGITVVGANLADTITTGAGNDVIVGRRRADTHAGGAGDDAIMSTMRGDRGDRGGRRGQRHRRTRSVSYALAAGSRGRAAATGSIVGHRRDRPDRQRARQPDLRQ